MPFTKQLSELIKSLCSYRPLGLFFFPVSDELYYFSSVYAGHHSKPRFIYGSALRFVTLANCVDVERAHNLKQILVANAIGRRSPHKRPQRLLHRLEEYRALVIDGEFQVQSGPYP